MRRFASIASLAVLASVFSTAAFAHPGDHSHVGFAAGFAHPLTGIDHLLAMVAVGLWASQLGGRALWAALLAGDDEKQAIGPTRAGNRLVCGPGAWSTTVRTYAYRWLVDGRRVRGARGRTLAVKGRLRGRAVRCRVTESNAAGATTAVSAPLRIGARS